METYGGFLIRLTQADILLYVRALMKLLELILVLDRTSSGLT